MGDMNNNQNNGNEFDSSQITPDSQENMDYNPADSINQSFENETEPYNMDSSPYEQSYLITPDISSGRRPGPKIIAAFILIAVLLAGSVLAFANRHTLLNTFALMTKSPLEYYYAIEKKSINKGIDTLTESYDKSLTLNKEKKASGAAQDVDVKLTVSPQFTDMAELTDFQSLEAKISSLSKDNNGKTAIGIFYNEQSLVTLNTFFNLETDELFVSIPELSSAYLLFSLNEIMSYYGETGYIYEDYAKEIEDVFNNDLLTPEILNSLLKKYTALMIQNIDNIKLDKNVSVTASGLNGTYNLLTSEIQEIDAYNMVIDVLNEAKIDETVKKLFAALNICEEEEYTELINNAIKELIAEEELVKESSESILMNVYVDQTGKIMGREFVTKEEKVSGCGYYYAEKGSKIGYTVWIKEDDVNIFEFSGNGTLNADGFSGTSVLSFSEYSYNFDDYTTYSVNIDIENANIVKSNSYINGKFTITSASFMGGSVIITCTADEQKQNITFQVNYGGLEAVSLDITCKEGAYEDFELPSSTNSQVYDAVTDSYSYMETADIQGFITHLEEVAGQDLESLFNAILYKFAY